jgi:clan AA aspartic protease
MMGAVRVSIKLKNAVDEELVSRGLLAPRLLREVEVTGLVDTGAVSLVIPQDIATQLGLRILTQRVAEFANGDQQTIGVTGAIIVECENRATTDEALVVGNEVLIGQVILEKLDLLVDCKNQKLIPNPANPNYPVAMIK